MTYPNKCVRCGFCCLSEACPVAMQYFGIQKQTKCPALTWNGVEAVCGIINAFSNLIMGVGAGCCIKARCYKSGVEYDFASLPGELKIILAQGLKEEKGV